MTQVSTPLAKEGVPPRVSIGLPVYNGENYLEKAIDSILAQSFSDFELIVCDNASTDATGSICESFARRDARVRYYRNPRNVGAGPNYDLCFLLSRGTYFKWAAHDDLIAPDFLTRTIAALEGAPEAVLCGTAVTEIGPDDEVLRIYGQELPGVTSSRPSERFAAMVLIPHGCTDFFGLFRREALLGSRLHGNYGGSDRVLLAEMALRGPFVRIADPIFFNRDHAARFTRRDLVQREKTSHWLDTSQKGGRQFHYGTVYATYWKIVNTHVHAPAERWACYGHLIHWLFIKYNLRELVNELLWNVSPGIHAALLTLKRKLMGARGLQRPQI